MKAAWTPTACWWWAGAWWQRALGIGYGKASRFIDYMAEDGIVGAFNVVNLLGVVAGLRALVEDGEVGDTSTLRNPESIPELRRAIAEWMARQMPDATEVTITGTGFVINGTTVAFGTTAGTSVNVTSSTTLSVTAPAGSINQTVRGRGSAASA